MQHRGRVVVLGRYDHAEVRAVVNALPRESVIFIDDEWLIRGDHLGWGFTGSGEPVLRFGEHLVAAAEISSVYYRPGFRRISGEIMRTAVLPSPLLTDRYLRFGKEECDSFLVGALAGSGAFWVNHPALIEQADQKLAQLARARRHGLTVPPTLVTTDAAKLRRFWQHHGGMVVTKSICALPARSLGEPLPTRQVEYSELARLGEMSPCPTLFQKLIPASLDVRVTLVGEESFGTAIHSQEGRSPLDWRLDQTVRFTEHMVPEGIVERLQRLRRELGLTYAAADLRLTPEGEYFFFELNPEGSFWFVQQLTGAPIAAAISHVLANPPVRDPAVDSLRVDLP